MDDTQFYDDLNHLLTTTFDLVMDVESDMLSMTRLKLSISEVHLIEAIGNGDPDGITVGDVARVLRITPASVTVAVNKLHKKGFLGKCRGQADARTVFVSLTPDGYRVYRLHRRFHRSMVRNMAGDLNEQERTILLSSVQKLNDFFVKKVHDRP